MFNAVMDAVADEALPVRIQAAIALPELVRYEDGESLPMSRRTWTDFVCSSIGHVCQHRKDHARFVPLTPVSWLTLINAVPPELLKLADQVDLDALTNTTRALVSEFAAEVVPFAVQLSQQLVSLSFRLPRPTLMRE
jgi:hypothetical protein